MSCCGEKRTKSRCGTLTPAVCVKYEGEFPEWSSLKDESCTSIEEVAEELYDKIGDVQETVELGNIDNCINYDRETDGTVKINTAVTKHAELLCELLGAGDPSGKDLSPDISRWGLNYGCLVDECGNPPTTLKQLLQLLINGVCGGNVQGFSEGVTPFFAPIPFDEEESEETEEKVTNTNTTPDWQRTGIISTSSDADEYISDVNGQNLFSEEQDINPESDTFGQFRWTKK